MENILSWRNIDSCKYIKKILKSIQYKKVLDLIKDISLNYGKIICKATLKDCIEMTLEHIKKIKDNEKEFSLGIYSEGRYAWLLDNIQYLKEQKEVKGKLGYYTYKKEKKNMMMKSKKTII